MGLISDCVRSMPFYLFHENVERPKSLFNTRRVISTCHTNTRYLMRLIKITVYGFLTSVQNCMSCTSIARARFNLTPCMGGMHETVTAASCRLFCRHCRLGAAAHAIRIKAQYFVVFSLCTVVLDKWRKRKSIKLRCCRRSLQCLLKSNYVVSASSVYPATLVTDDTYSWGMGHNMNHNCTCQSFLNGATFAHSEMARIFITQMQLSWHSVISKTSVFTT